MIIMQTMKQHKKTDVKGSLETLLENYETPQD